MQNLLGRAGVYERAKASWIYDVFWRLADRTVIDDRDQEVEFYRRLLDGFRKGYLIFDIGANHGYKTDMFLRLGGTVVAVEPDEKSRKILEQKFLTHRFKRKPLHIVGKALSDRSSVACMWVDAPGSAKNTLSHKWAALLREDENRFGHRLSFDHCRMVETISIESLIEAYGAPFFVKIDVEGHELKVLEGLKRPVPYLSFEVNLPEFRSEGIMCIEVLGALSIGGEFNYTSDCRSGLAMKKWCRAQDFVCTLNRCPDPSIEVFWKNQ